MKLGIVLASRGTMFSKTMESVFNNLKHAFKAPNYELYMAHGLPIPDCFNTPLEKALDDGCGIIWFVEEDMDIPADTLSKMFALDEPVVTTNYADRRTGVPLILRNNGEIDFSGMGCMLVRREVFEKMERPYCRKMVFWKVENEDGTHYWQPHPEVECKDYGTQDIYLCWAMRNAGYRIVELENVGIGHMSLLTKAEDLINNGGDIVKTVYLPDVHRTTE
jgi:hypothetical protein